MMTIKELREILDRWEQDWTDKDQEFLGRFEDQVVVTDCFDGKGKFAGIGAAKVLPQWELGLWITGDEDVPLG